MEKFKKPLIEIIEIENDEIIATSGPNRQHGSTGDSGDDDIEVEG